MSSHFVTLLLVAFPFDHNHVMWPSYVNKLFVHYNEQLLERHWVGLLDCLLPCYYVTSQASLCTARNGCSGIQWYELFDGQSSCLQQKNGKSASRCGSFSPCCLPIISVFWRTSD
jgi:hypothetical protein